ncbi:hypothetical protein M8C21_022055 [Ambrosia artemisiifolia]|uniref:GRF-type domain-containing protein n=1 Tax=Ambrosia artemisiifolia TaxID=4212 RepID=A0AAD5BV82_AMBAR|nr:hypothetical protein M8C21_022055 [Ambrosia artemisiifolia]
MELCNCRREAILKTSWTNDKPGRRFYTCPLQNGCQYFNWFDPPMCERSTKIIPGLLRSKNRLEGEVTYLNTKLKRKNYIICCLVISLIFSKVIFGAAGYEGN